MKRLRNLIILSLSCMMLQSYTHITATQTTVYLCVTGEVYHSTRSCRGLNKATHKIIAVSKQDAVNKYKRRPCKICY